MKSKNVISASFYFLRHGESENNRQDRVNGWRDSPLTERGEVQARAAGLILAQYPIQRIVTSDLQRAHRTAEIVAETHAGSMNIEVYPGLRERHWGIYENQPRSLRPELDEVPEGGEGPDDYYHRVVNTLAQIHLHHDALIVAHAGTLRVLHRILGLNEMRARVANTSPVYYFLNEAWNQKFL